jgi:hypothetical protein
MDHRPDAGDDQRHHRGQAVEVESNLEVGSANRGPTVSGLDQRRIAAGFQGQQ